METCPQCGWTSITPQKPFSNVMSTYVNLKDGKKATFNADDEKIKTADGQEWMLEKAYLALPKKEVTITPPTPKAPAADKK